MAHVHDPRSDAAERVGGRYEVRVLEPSPPAVNAPPFFADDPAVPGDVPEGREVVTPTTAGDHTWDELCRQDPELADWCADRWLGAWRRLSSAPDALARTRESLHVLAEHVLAPARHAANGKIGLRWTRGGFGTPYFAEDVQVRVEGADLVVEQGGWERRSPISTVGAAADLSGVEPGAPDGVYTPTTTFDPDVILAVDPEASAFLGDWFGFAASVLEQLRSEADPAADPSRVQLWPEHFDLAFEQGDADAGRRASFGLSPGDEAHALPYVYVAPWEPPAADPFWNAVSFRGAELRYPELLRAADQREAALAFLRRGRDLLSA